MCHINALLFGVEHNVGKPHPPPDEPPELLGSGLDLALALMILSIVPWANLPYVVRLPFRSEVINLGATSSRKSEGEAHPLEPLRRR